MNKFTLELTAMANGGAALGRDTLDRVIFVPLAIPGERVEVEIIDDRKRYAWAKLIEVLSPSPDRITPRCPHFGPCGGCHFQHIGYPAQLKYKQGVVRDQLKLIGRMGQVDVRPVWPNPKPWASSTEIQLTLSLDGELGFWSSLLGQVMSVETCHLIHPALLALFQDVDLVLPGLRKITLRMGNDSTLLVALEVDEVDPPALEADFPVSAAMVLPDGTAANLVGDNYLVHSIQGRDFRVSAGCFFYPSPPATNYLVETVLELAALEDFMQVLELYCGVGTLTAFLSSEVNEVFGIEISPDAVSDAAFNLIEHNNVTLYEGPVEEILPLIGIPPDGIRPDIIIVDPPESGLPRTIVEQLVRLKPDRLLYISSDLATLARDSRQLSDGGLHLVKVQPIDMYPQTFRTTTVSLWTKSNSIS